MTSKRNIAILGAGNLGLAMARGLDNAGYLKDRHLYLTRRHTSSIKGFDQENVSLTTDNLEAVRNAEVLILSVQPSQLEGLLMSIREVLEPKKHILVSVITAKSISEISSMLPGHFPVIRAMPNTAIAVRQSMTCMAHNGVDNKVLAEADDIFNCVGKTLIIEEEMLQAATVVCASGIAFWMRFIRATTQGGVQLGFDAAEAQMIAVQTCLGAASLLQNSDNHPEQEIDRVTTPQGCTIAGLNEMEHNGLSSALIKGLVTSYNRINQMKTKHETL